MTVFLKILGVDEVHHEVCLHLEPPYVARTQGSTRFVRFPGEDSLPGWLGFVELHEGLAFHDGARQVEFLRVVVDHNLILSHCEVVTHARLLRLHRELFDHLVVFVHSRLLCLGFGEVLAEEVQLFSDRLRVGSERKLPIGEILETDTVDLCGGFWDRIISRTIIIALRST